MPRSIDNFFGNNAVIGCSANHSSCKKKCHPSDSYYSIDINPAIDPDLCIDIKKKLPPKLIKRFQIVLVEYLDGTSYNDSPAEYPPHMRKEGRQGFENIWNLTAEDGFIFIVGCPREKDFRRSFEGLKYVELSKDINEEYSCVIIPKNQKLSIDEVNQSIKSNAELVSLSGKLNKFTYVPVDYQFTFFNYSYSSLPTTQQTLQHPQPIEEESGFLKENKQIPAVKALYDAINILSTALTQDVNREQNKVNSIFFTTRNKDYTAGLLMCNANRFFKHPTRLIQRDIADFKFKFSLLIKKCEIDFLKNAAHKPLLANILTACQKIAFADYEQTISICEETVPPYENMELLTAREEVNELNSTSKELTDEYERIIKKLYTVTMEYKESLAKNNLQIHAIVDELIETLNHPAKNQDTIKKYFEILNTPEQNSAMSNMKIIQRNKERSTKRFVAGIAAIALTLVTGILPGLIVIGIVYAITGQTPLDLFKNHSQFFAERLNNIQEESNLEILRLR